MDKDVKKRIQRQTAKSTIPQEIKVLYEMANATDLMNAQIFERLRYVYINNGIDCGPNDLLSGLHDYCKAVRSAACLFEKHIERQLVNATKDHRDGYSWLLSDTNELCRLVLLYIDRCAMNNENAAVVFDLLQTLPSGGIFAKKDINKYRMNEG